MGRLRWLLGVFLVFWMVGVPAVGASAQDASPETVDETAGTEAVVTQPPGTELPDPDPGLKTPDETDPAATATIATATVVASVAASPSSAPNGDGVTAAAAPVLTVNGSSDPAVLVPIGGIVYIAWSDLDLVRYFHGSTCTGNSWYWNGSPTVMSTSEWQAFFYDDVVSIRGFDRLPQGGETPVTTCRSIVIDASATATPPGLQLKVNGTSDSPQEVAGWTSVTVTMSGLPPNAIVYLSHSTDGCWLDGATSGGLYGYETGPEGTVSVPFLFYAGVVYFQGTLVIFADGASPYTYTNCVQVIWDQPVEGGQPTATAVVSTIGPTVPDDGPPTESDTVIPTATEMAADAGMVSHLPNTGAGTRDSSGGHWFLFTASVMVASGLAIGWRRRHR